MSGRVLSLAAALLLAGGCADDGSGGSAEPTRSPVSSTTGDPGPIPVEDVLVAQLTLPGDPDWLASDDNGVWVQRGSGEVALVDPATNELAFAVPLGDIDLCQGIGASFGSGWACRRSDVVRIDPATREVVATLAVGKQAGQGHLVGGFGRVWVLTGDGSTLVGIDAATEEVAVEVELGARCVDVALSADAVWLPCLVDDRVLKVDPASGEVVLDVDIPNAMSIAADDEVWVGTAGSTVQVDPTDGGVLREVDAGTGAEGRIAIDADSVWVRSAEEFLIRVDRVSAEVVQRFSADVTSGGDVLARDGEVWVTAYDDQVLFRLAPGAAG
jgi:streptogramin lyase